MNITKSMILGLSTVAFCTGILGTACSKKEPISQPTTNIVANANYTAPNASSLPTRYENISGVALYSVNSEIRDQLATLAGKAPGGIDKFFVLLNPQMPTEGILVKTSESISISNDTISNNRINLTGNVMTINDSKSDMVSYFHDKYGFNLACDGQGNPIYIEAETIGDSISSTQTASDKNDVITATNSPQVQDSQDSSETTIPDITSETAITPYPVSEANKDIDQANTNSMTSQVEEVTQPIVESSERVRSLNVTPAPPNNSTLAPQRQSSNDSPRRSHNLNVTPIPSSRETSPSNNPSTETAISSNTDEQNILSSETVADIPQDIAPTVQPLSTDPIPQNVAPTSQPLE